MAESPFGPRVARKTLEGAPGDKPPPVQETARPSEPSNASRVTARFAEQQPSTAAAAVAKPSSSVASSGVASRFDRGGGANQPQANRPRGSNFFGTPQATVFATTIQSFVRANVSLRLTLPRLQEYYALVIQAEFRDYLYRTRNVRATLRRRREADRNRLRLAVEALIAQTRQNGKAIVMAEAAEWNRITLAFDEGALDAIVQEEARVRELEGLSECAVWSEVIEEFCPSFMNPDREAEYTEYRERNQIARVWRSEINTLMLLHVAAKALHARREQRDAREAVWVAEARERAEIVAACRVDFFQARLATLPGVEAELRRVMELQREDYMTALQKQLYVSLRTVLAVSLTVPEAEPQRRFALMRQETSELKMYWDVYRATRLQLLTRELLDEEREGRLGVYGIVRSEIKMRSRIMGAVVGVQLQLLQRNDMEDVKCETGSRTAIRWQEGREWYALMQKNAVVAATWQIPCEESSARLQLARAERAARDELLRSLPTKQLLVAHEFVSRRNIFSLWCHDFAFLAYEYAKIQIRGQEELRRRQLLRVFQLQLSFVEATEYLWFAELRDRDVLRQGKMRLAAQSTKKSGWLRAVF